MESRRKREVNFADAPALWYDSQSKQVPSSTEGRRCIPTYLSTTSHLLQGTSNVAPLICLLAWAPGKMDFLGARPCITFLEKKGFGERIALSARISPSILANAIHRAISVSLGGLLEMRLPQSTLGNIYYSTTVNYLKVERISIVNSRTPVYMFPNVFRMLTSTIYVAICYMQGV